MIYLYFLFPPFSLLCLQMNVKKVGGKKSKRNRERTKEVNSQYNGSTEVAKDW